MNEGASWDCSPPGGAINLGVGAGPLVTPDDLLEGTDGEIDTLVYELAEEEVAIVRGRGH